MTEDTQGAGDPRGGDRRGGDRRRRDRRKTDRRAPPPVWRRPWALVTYGAVGALAVVLLLGDFGEEEAPASGELTEAPVPRPVSATPQVPAGPTQDAFGNAAFERLVIEGETAKGRVVRTELFCAAPTAMAVQDVGTVDPSLAPLIDDDGRVRAAECKWGSRGDARRGDFVLVVPPALADEFASTPVTTDDFVQRRRVVAEVEWLGRSRPLALRTAGVLRGLAADDR